MYIFNFDQYYMQRQSYDDCWYVYTQPSGPVDETGRDRSAHGDFSVSTGRFVKGFDDQSDFSDDQKLEIEALLSAHKDEMGLEQFEAHEVMPPHYREIPRRSDRYKDLIRRIRVPGTSDPAVSVAYEQLDEAEPAYRLTREFITRVLERSKIVSQQDIDEWLHESMLDTWTYDCGEEEPFESFYASAVKALMVPDPLDGRRREFRTCKLYEVEGLEGVYLTYKENRYWELVDSEHFIDVDGVVLAPSPFPSRSGTAYYIL